MIPVGQTRASAGTICPSYGFIYVRIDVIGARPKKSHIFLVCKKGYNFSSKFIDSTEANTCFANEDPGSQSLEIRVRSFQCLVTGRAWGSWFRRRQMAQVGKSAVWVKGLDSAYLSPLLGLGQGPATQSLSPDLRGNGFRDLLFAQFSDTQK